MVAILCTTYTFQGSLNPHFRRPTSSQLPRSQHIPSIPRYSFSSSTCQVRIFLLPPLRLCHIYPHPIGQRHIRKTNILAPRTTPRILQDSQQSTNFHFSCLLRQFHHVGDVASDAVYREACGRGACGIYGSRVREQGWEVTQDELRETTTWPVSK